MKFFNVPRFTALASTLAFASFLPETAFAQFASTAQGKDWVAPAIGFIDVLQGGMVQAAVAIIGIGIIIIGGWMALGGGAHEAPKKIGLIIVGGILVMAGPKMLAALLTALQ